MYHFQEINGFIKCKVNPSLGYLFVQNTFYCVFSRNDIKPAENTYICTAYNTPCKSARFMNVLKIRIQLLYQVYKFYKVKILLRRCKFLRNGKTSFLTDNLPKNIHLDNHEKSL